MIRSEFNVPCFDAFERNVFEKVRKHFFDRILRGIVGRREREREIDKEEEGGDREMGICGNATIFALKFKFSIKTRGESSHLTSRPKINNNLPKICFSSFYDFLLLSLSICNLRKNTFNMK